MTGSAYSTFRNARPRGRWLETIDARGCFGPSGSASSCADGASGQQRGEHGVEALAAGNRRGEPVSVEGQEAAFNQRRESVGEQGLGNLAGDLFQARARNPF